jgi:hypothetical protein
VQREANNGSVKFAIEGHACGVQQLECRSDTLALSKG